MTYTKRACDELDKLMKTCICGDDDVKQIKQFLISKLEEQAEELKKCVPEKLQPEGIVWVMKFNNGVCIGEQGAIGYNQAISETNKNIDQIKKLIRSSRNVE
jgi:hypothetical protein